MSIEFGNLDFITKSEVLVDKHGMPRTGAEIIVHSGISSVTHTLDLLSVQFSNTPPKEAKVLVPHTIAVPEEGAEDTDVGGGGGGGAPEYETPGGLLKPQFKHIPKKPAAGKMAARHLDLVLGLDLHLLTTPFPGFPLPVTPFLGIILDPTDYIHCNVPMPIWGPSGKDGKGPNKLQIKKVPMGGTVTIGGFYKGAVTSSVVGVPPFGLHFVVPQAIILVANILAGHDGEVYYGHETVKAQGVEMTSINANVLTCTHIGMPLPNLSFAKKIPIPFALYNDMMSRVMVTFHNRVQLGGAVVPHKFSQEELINRFIGQAVLHVVKSAAKAAIKGALKTKSGVKFTNFLCKKAGKIKNPIIRSFSKKVVKGVFGGDPVNFATGAMLANVEGFELPGPLPLRWEATYFSDSSYDGPLGKNIYHSYEARLSFDAGQQVFVHSSNEGVPTFFPVPQPGEEEFNIINQLTLGCISPARYYVKDKEGLTCYFDAQPGSRDEYLLTRLQDRGGSHISFVHKGTQLDKIIDSSGRVLAVEWDQAGRLITAITMPHPTISGLTVKQVSYTYSAEGQLLTATDAEGNVSSFEWQGRLITRRVYPGGQGFRFVYDRQGRCIDAPGDGGVLSYRFAYHTGYTIVTNAVGSSSTYYHTDGLVKRIVNSLGGETLYSHTYFDELASVQLPDGRLRTYDYDEWGNVTLINEGGSVTTIAYNRGHQPVEATMPNGGKWQWAYDEAGLNTAETDPLGAVRRYGYESGLLRSIINAAGAETRVEYNRQRMPANVSLPNGTSIGYSYDRWGRLTTIKDPLGNFATYEHNLLGAVTRAVTTAGTETRLRYDGMGNVIHAAGKHQEVSLAYNFFSNVTRRTQGKNSVRFRYNNEGQLLGVVNEHGEQYRFELDSEGNVISETGFDGLTRHYLRNAGGQVTQTRRPGGHTDRYHYNSAGQMTTLLHEADGSAEHYEYDVMGSLVRAANSESEVVLQRDVLGRITGEQSGGYSLSSEYNRLGQRTRLQSSLGADIAIGYSEVLSRVERMSASGWAVQMQHNEVGQEVLRQMNGGVQQKADYDRAGRLKQQSILGAGRRLKHYRQYNWDGDRLTGIKDTATGEKLFRHDVHGNLAEVIYGDGTVEYRAPDAVGNLFESKDRKDRTYARGGRLLESRTAKYKYDEEGNLIEKQERNGNLWRYAWNEAGMLTKVTRPDGGVVTFGYDALGRRLWKKYRKTITRWVWDGNKPLHEWKEFDAKDASADELITWVFKEDSFAPAAKIKGEKKYSIITDHLDTPSQMYAEDGTLCWQGALDSYGRMRMEKGETGSCPFRYQGQYEDKEIGLYYNRFRYYSPEEGIYLSQDPIRLAGGSRLYGYVDDPNVWVDVFGLSCSAARAAKKEIQALEAKYGASNVHSLDRHGAQTTIRQQFNRANHGILPDGTLSYKTNAARFTSHVNHAAAMNKAIDNFILDNGVTVTTQGYRVEFDIGRDVAEGYLKDGSTKIVTSKVIATFNHNGDLVSLYGDLRP